MAKTKIELTPAQYSVVARIIYEVQDKLRWDEHSKYYVDGGDIVIALDKEEYKTLMNITTL